jgi:hypothetical protein
MNYAARQVVPGATGVSTEPGSLGVHFNWDYAFALKNDGTVISIRGASATATPLPGLSNVARVIMGASQLFVLFRNGTVGAYFTNEDPPPGNVTMVPGLDDIVDIAASWDQLYAIDDAGKAYTLTLGSAITEITEPSGLAFVSRSDGISYALATDAQGSVYYLSGGSVVAIPSLHDVATASVRHNRVLVATSDGGISFMSIAVNTPKAIHVPH